MIPGVLGGADGPGRLERWGRPADTVPRAGWGPTVGVGLGAGAAAAGLGMGFPAMIMAPLLFAWLRIRCGVVGSLVGAGVGLGVGGVLGSGEAVTATIVWGLTGTILGWASARGWAARLSVALASVPLVGLSAIQAALVSRVEIREAFLSEIEVAVARAVRVNSTLGTSPEDLARARDLALRAAELLWVVTPAVGVVFAVAVSFVVYRLGQWLFPRFGAALRPVAPLRTWAVGERFAWVLAAGLALEVSRVEWASAAGHNVLVVVGLVYLVQGLAVLHHWLETRRVPRLGQALVWIVGLVFLQPLSGLAAIATGFLDTWVDFRRRLGPGRTRV